jgi:DNA-binding NarL/FixJ family response regulator
LKPINVILVDMPTMLREIVSGVIADQADIEVVAEVASAGEAEALLGDRAKPWALIGSGGLAVTEIEELLDAAPRAKLLTLSVTADRFLLYELRPQRVDLGEVSPPVLVEAIRSARGPAAMGGEA